MPACGSSLNPDHCCYIAGEPCPFLRDDGPQVERRWVCTLRERLGSWEAVHEDPGYIEHVHPTLAPFGFECGDWPPPGVRCESCGLTR